MQIPTQPPQRETNRAGRRLRGHVIMNPGYLVTPPGLVRDQIVDRYEGGYELDLAVAVIDDLVATGELEEIGLHTYRRREFLRQPPAI